MVTDGNKARVAEAPPHELNVRKFAESRASELQSLHSIVASRLNNDFRSQRCKRKRTTGHDDRVPKKTPRRRTRVGIGNMQKSESLRKDEKKIPRRVRRNIELKKNPQSGFVTSGDGTKRLRTHVWHAKRFTMSKLWGFHLPLGLHGRGRGSRALLKKLRNGVLLHDASYNGIVQLEGPQDMLVSILSSVLGPISSERCEEFSQVLSGEIFGSAMLYHAGKEFSQPIAPLIYAWRPPRLITAAAKDHSSNVYDEKQCIDDGTTIRKVWMWIHAAALKEAFQALSFACNMQIGLTGSLVQCTSLEGHLGKLELVGSKAFQLLEKTLLPFSSISEKFWHTKRCSVTEVGNQGEQEKTSILEDNFGISTRAVVPFTVKDPRSLNRKDHVNAPQPNNCLHFSSHEGCDTEEPTNFLLPKHRTECQDLWDASQGICPPMEERDICMHKNRQHKEFVRLAHKTYGTQTDSADREYSEYCPILLLKNKNYKDSTIWFSVILPLSWIKVFWITFVSNGAHAIGLREKNWIAGEIGMPCFPLDFPDCNAYSDFMVREASTSDQKTMLLPPSKRPLKFPIGPPWNSVQHCFEKGLRGDSCSQDKEIGSDPNENEIILKTSECRKSKTTMLDCPGAPFEGFVARTSSMLSDFLNVENVTRLQLFPRIRGQKGPICKFTDSEFVEQCLVTSEVKYGKARCFLRVLLHAYKEGVFKQGAVVCAPRVADIVMWIRSDNDSQQLQIPESLLKSYFMQLPSGKWQLQTPEDAAAQESFRWPIGFVTTGFVRGSRKATAGALCETTLLSRIRMEQWKALPVRQKRNEIFVLVRNMRSTTYRLALATIVLEQQDKDVDFI